MNTNWHNISYLLQGSYRQKLAHEVLVSLDILKVLKKFSPILVGTIPLKIDTEQSDLDLICEVYDSESLKKIVTLKYGDKPEFEISERAIKGIHTVVARFHYQDFMIEIFGQPVPVEKQHAYQHMVVEARLLRIGGSEAKKKIRTLKLNGMKTEHAFAHYFNLTGDPYLVLLQLAQFSESELCRIIEMI